MGVPADKNIGGIALQFVLKTGIVFTRITADMCDPDIHFFAVKTLMQGVHGAQFMAINIPVHATQGLESGKLVGNIERSEITGMPYFVALFEIRIHFGGEKTVGVGKQADSFHETKIKKAF